jgi:hypothetical protein
MKFSMTVVSFYASYSYTVLSCMTDSLKMAAMGTDT